MILYIFLHFPDLCVPFALFDHKKKHKGEEGQECGEDSDKKGRKITIRPLSMEDFKEAKNQVKNYSTSTPRKKLSDIE